MSMERYFRWTCNICGQEKEQEGYGLPPNWGFIGATLKIREVTHVCRVCIIKHGIKRKDGRELLPTPEQIKLLKLS